MIIQKNRENIGWYSAQTHIKGEFFVGSDKTMVGAVERLFAKLQWLDIGNWNKNPSMGKTTSTFGAVSDLIALSK